MTDVRIELWSTDRKGGRHLRGMYKPSRWSFAVRHAARLVDRKHRDVRIVQLRVERVAVVG